MQEEPDANGEILSDVGTTLSERLQRAMARSGIHPAELGRRVGVSRASVSDWLNGTTKSLAGDNLVKAAEALQVNPRWLQTGFGPEAVVRPGALARTQTRDIEPAYDGLRTVPVLTLDQAAKLMPGLRPQSDTMYPITEIVGPNAFALRQQGESMEPRIPDGAMVVIDPDSPVEHGHVVLAHRPGDLHAVLRQLWFDGGLATLRAIRPSYPVLDMPPTTNVIGRAVLVSLTL